MVFYGYSKCSTCRKAKAYLSASGASFEEVDITSEPPTKTVLRALLRDGGYKLQQLFNRSGEEYRRLKISKKLPELSEDKALDLLSRNGRLIKRPIVTDGKRHTVGFDEALFKRLWR